jgi:SAM-dependent methyltransferase
VQRVTQVPTRQNFVDAYASVAPWDIGRPQAAFVGVADQVVSPVLDAGCGTGDAAIFFAERGHAVTGIDFLEEPIRRAQEKAAKRGVTVEFRAADALALDRWTERFNTVLDSGLFHCFADADRKQYVAGLAHVLNPGGCLFLQCFSNAEPGEFGPRRITRAELETAFAAGWQIESIEPTRFETNPDFTAATFSEGGPKSWFVAIRRQEKCARCKQYFTELRPLPAFLRVFMAPANAVFHAFNASAFYCDKCRRAMIVPTAVLIVMALVVLWTMLSSLIRGR